MPEIVKICLNLSKLWSNTIGPFFRTRCKQWTNVLFDYDALIEFFNTIVSVKIEEWI